VRAPIDRRSSTFGELVAEVLAELDRARLDRGGLPLDHFDEDEVIRFLADEQRRWGRSLRMDALVAGLWRYWEANADHGREWRRRRDHDHAGDAGRRRTT
jgi:hypothetical protein